ncbi:MAG TPA: HemK/PrmC family methyltransferase, partial [Candidatus Gracilibacteria bacterium]|nr:HemK/PrmC family methyltransferase [Candidatus Gracilibacteria bacterium]
MGLTIKEALDLAKTAWKNLENPNYESRYLLTELLQTDFSELITNPQKPLSESEIKTWQDWIIKRQNKYPAAYICQKAYFRDMSFFVNEDVLIPRPETEELVDIAANLIEQHHYQNILEVGIGSGCISISLAKLFPNLHFSATDISEKALKVAQTNCQIHQIPNLQLELADLIPSHWQKSKWD